jgi:Golgi apparatus protein 1
MENIMSPWKRASLLLTLAFLFWVSLPDRSVCAWPCQEEIRKFCKDVKPGGGRVDQCLHAHEAEISPECREARLEMKEKVRGTLDACEADLQKFCGRVAGGKARIARCMKEHEAELSPGCRERAVELKDLMGPGNPCHGDQEKFCADVVPGEGRILDCILEHQPELSEACNIFIAGTMNQVREKITEYGQAFMDACKDDVQRHCRGIPAGKNRLVNCLREHEAELSGTCRAKVRPGGK